MWQKIRCLCVVSLMAGALGQAPAWGLTSSPQVPDNYDFTTNWLSRVDSLESSIPFNPALRTNLLWFGASEPNIGFEAQVGPVFSVGVNLGLKVWPRWAPWDWDESGMNRHWRNFAIVPEVRWWPAGVYEGFFAGTDFIYTHYNVGAVTFPFGMYPDVRNYRLQGSYWAGGIFAGYSWALGEHWRIEAEAGISGGLAAYDRYDCPHCGTMINSEHRAAFVPKLGVNIAWNPVSHSDRASRSSLQRALLNLVSPPEPMEVRMGIVGGETEAAAKFNGEIALMVSERRYEEAVAAIQSDESMFALVGTDAEASNIYGTVLYLVALDRADATAEKEAIRIVESAVEAGSEAARANRDSISVYGADRKEYEALIRLITNEEQ